MDDNHRPPGQIDNYLTVEEMDAEGEMRLLTEDGGTDMYVVEYADEGVKEQLANLDEETRVRLRLQRCSNRKSDFYEVTEFIRKGWL